MSQSRKNNRGDTRVRIVDAEAPGPVDTLAIGRNPSSKQKRIKAGSISAKAIAKDTPSELVVGRSDKPQAVKSKATIKRSKVEGDASASSEVNIHFNVTMPPSVSPALPTLTAPSSSASSALRGRDEMEEENDEEKDEEKDEGEEEQGLLLFKKTDSKEVPISKKELELKNTIVSYAKHNRSIHHKIDLATYLETDGQLDCSFVRLDKTNLSGSIFKEVKFYQAKFRQCNLKDAKFIDSNLSKASFRHAELTNVDFTGSDLSLSDISYAKGLTWELLEKAEFTDLVVDEGDIFHIQIRGAVIKIKSLSNQLKQGNSSCARNKMQSAALKKVINPLEIEELTARPAKPLQPDWTPEKISIPYPKKRKVGAIRVHSSEFIDTLPSIEHSSIIESSIIYSSHSRLKIHNSAHSGLTIQSSSQSSSSEDKSYLLLEQEHLFVPKIAKSNELPGLNFAIDRFVERQNNLEYEAYVELLTASLAELEKKEKELELEFDALIKKIIKNGLLDKNSAQDMQHKLQSAHNEKEMEGIIIAALFDYALYHNESVACKLLAENLEQVNASSIQKTLYFAARQGLFELAKALLDAKASPPDQGEREENPLAIAVQNDHYDIVKLLLDKKASVDSPLRGDATLLHVAAGNDRSRVAQLLLEHRAYISNKDKNGWLPIEVAAYHGSAQMVKLLLEEEKSTYNYYYLMRDDNELYLLHLACRNKQDVVVRLLLDAKVAANETDLDDETPLSISIDRAYSHSNIIAMLLEAKEMINEVNTRGETLLLIAVKKGKQNTVELLVEQKANVNLGSKKTLRQSHLPENNTPLMVAAQEGHTKIAEILLKAGAIVNQENENGETPLYIAAAKDHLSMAQLLIEARATVDCKLKKKSSYWPYYALGSTPLIAAARHRDDHTKMVKCLIEAKAAVNEANQEGVTPLIVSTESGHYQTMRYLIQARADVDSNLKNPESQSLLTAAGGNDIGMVSLLLEKKANANQKNKKGETALLAATREGHLEVAKLLVGQGAGVNHANAEGETAMYLALSGKYYCKASLRSDLVNFLIEAKAEVNHQTKKGDTALLAAVKSGGASDVISLLLEKKANVNQEDYHRETPLLGAAAGGHLEVAKLLVKQGARVNHAGWCNQTPIYRVLSYTYNNSLRPDLVSFLIEAKAEVNHMTEGGDTTLLTAAGRGHPSSVVSLLLEKNANVNQENEDGVTPLYRASGGNYFEVAQLLIKARANVNHPLLKKDKFDCSNKAGNTPLLAAAREGHLEVAKLLVRQGAGVNHANAEGETAIYLASSGDRNAHLRSDLVNLLIEAKADVEYSTKKKEISISDKGGEGLRSRRTPDLLFAASPSLSSPQLTQVI